MAKTLTKESLTEVRRVLTTALESCGHELGLDLKVGNMRYDSYHVTITVEGLVPGVLQPAQQMYDLQASRLGLPPRGSKIRFNGGEIRTVWGWNSKAPKFPILLEVDGEVEMKCTIAHLERAEVVA